MNIIALERCCMYLCPLWCWVMYSVYTKHTIANREVKYLLINITVCIYFICFGLLSIFRMISLSKRLQHYRKCSYSLHFLKPSAITSSHFVFGWCKMHKCSICPKCTHETNYKLGRKHFQTNLGTPAETRTPTKNGHTS